MSGHWFDNVALLIGQPHEWLSMRQENGQKYPSSSQTKSKRPIYPSLHLLKTSFLSHFHYHHVFSASAPISAYRALLSLHYSLHGTLPSTSPDLTSPSSLTSGISTSSTMSLTELSLLNYLFSKTSKFLAILVVDRRSSRKGIEEESDEESVSWREFR